MEAIHFFTIGGKYPTGDEAFCWILNVAVEALAREKFGKSPVSTPFELTPQFITEAYEKIKHVQVEGCSGQQAQEFLVTSILKKYLELNNPGRSYMLAYPNHVSVDSMLVDIEKGAQFKDLGNGNGLAQGEIIVYPFQIKEMREEEDIFTLAAKSAAAEEHLIDFDMFKKFMARFKEKIIGEHAYGDVIPILFMRASATSSFSVPEIAKAFQEANQGYFKQIWMIAPVHDLVGENGVRPPMPKPGLNFLIHNLLQPIPEPQKFEFVVVTMNCELGKIFYPK